jgi:hypothetical protein
MQPAGTLQGVALAACELDVDDGASVVDVVVGGGLEVEELLVLAGVELVLDAAVDEAELRAIKKISQITTLTVI